MDTLLYIAGFIDGSLEPTDLHGTAWQADQQAQAAYREHGELKVKPPSRIDAERKQFERGLVMLEEAGMVFRAGDRIGLTREGDEAARRAAGLPTLGDAGPLLAFIRGCRARWSDGWLSETTLCGLKPLPRVKLGDPRTPEPLCGFLLAHLSPLLAARLVKWRKVDGFDGVFLYGAITPGKGDPREWLRALAGAKEYQHPAAYEEGWERAWTARRVAKPARPNLVCHLDPVDPPSRAY